MSREFSIDMIPGGTQTAVHCNQYESGDTWVFALYYDGGRYSIPADAAVYIAGTKPDGNAYKISGTVVDNSVHIVVTDQMTAVAGNTTAEVLAVSQTDGTTLYSANFPIVVEPSAVQADLNPSEIPTAITSADGTVYYSRADDIGDIDDLITTNKDNLVEALNEVVRAADAPYVEVTQTEDGATITVTDSHGTTSANIQNGAATDEQVAAWLEAHPAATTSIQDGAVTMAKLASAVKDKIDSIDTTARVSYAQFGAVLDGEHDDSAAVLAAHQYANSHGIPVVQHGGSLLVNFSNVPILTDCVFDLEFVIDNDTPNNAYVVEHDSTETVTASVTIGQGSAQVAANVLKGHYCTPYAELSTHSLGIRNSGSQSSNVQFYHRQPLACDLNGNVLTMFPWVATGGSVRLLGYSRLDEKGLSISGGHIVVNKDDAYGFPTLFYVARNNVRVSDFTVEVPSLSGAESSSGGLFTVKDCCNVIIENVCGLNNSGSGTMAHAYVFDIYQAWNVRIQNCNIAQGWGAMASHFSDSICMTNCVINRWDGHYGVFGNNTIRDCVFTGVGMIRIGYGAGTVDISGCVCNQNSNDSNLSNGFISFRNDFTTYYQGTVYLRYSRSNSNRIFNLSDYALADPGTVGTFPAETLKIVLYGADVKDAEYVFNNQAASRSIDLYCYDCPKLRFNHATTGITIRAYNSNIVSASVGSNPVYLYDCTAGSVSSTGNVWCSACRITGAINGGNAYFFSCHALTALTITATNIKVENCGATNTVTLTGTAIVHNSNKWGNKTVSGAIKVKTVSVATSNMGTASLDLLITQATVLSVYSRTGISGEYGRFTPYVVDSTWYVAVETSTGPVASTALDVVVYYIDKSE